MTNSHAFNKASQNAMLIRSQWSEPSIVDMIDLQLKRNRPCQGQKNSRSHDDTDLNGQLIFLSIPAC